MHRLPAKASIHIQGNVRAMEKKDIPAVFKLYKMQMEKYKLYYKYS